MSKKPNVALFRESYFLLALACCFGAISSKIAFVLILGYGFMIIPVKEKYALIKAMLACCALGWMFQFLAYCMVGLSLEVSFNLSTGFAIGCLFLFYLASRKSIFGTSFNIGFCILAILGFVIPLLVSIPPPDWLGLAPVEYAFLGIALVILVFTVGTWYFFKKLKTRYSQIQGSTWVLGSLVVDLRKFKLKAGAPHNPSLKESLTGISLVLFLFVLNTFNGVEPEFAFLLALKWATAFACAGLLFSSIMAKALFLETLETKSKKFKASRD